MELGGRQLFQLDDAELSGLDWPGNETPVIAIHGMTSNAMFYVGVAERLAGRRGLLALDLRGRGNSSKPQAGYGMEQHAHDIAAVMEQAGIEQAIIVGHSMGASVAAALAIHHPDRCAGVVFFDGGPLIFTDYFADQERVQQFLVSARGVDGRLHHVFPDRASYQTYWSELGIFTPEQQGPWLSAYADYDLADGATDLRASCSSDAVAADAVDLFSAAPILSATLDMPILGIFADSGVTPDSPPLARTEGLEAMEAAYRSLELVIVPGTNHYTIALADPAATIVADHLVAFAERCGR